MCVYVCVSALKVDSGRTNLLPHRGNRTCVSGVTVPMLSQLSYNLTAAQ